MLKILQTKLQQNANWEISDAQAGFRKGRGIREKTSNILWITEKARGFRETSTSVSLTTQKPFTLWIITNSGEFWKRYEYQTTSPVSWETYMKFKKQQLEPDMEKQTGSKLGKEYDKTAYWHPLILTSVQSASCEMLGCMAHKLD